MVLVGHRPCNDSPLGIAPPAQPKSNPSSRRSALPLGYQEPSLDRITLATAVASSEVLSSPGAITSNVRPPPPNTTVV